MTPTRLPFVVTDASGAEVSHRYEDLQSIGRPRDGTAIGYYSVPI